jgi:hypothetical protein
LRGPEASSDPESGDGQHGEAEGSVQSEDSERDECNCGEEKKDCGARGWRWNLGDGLAECEAEGGSEQRNTAEADRLDAREPGPETALKLVM